MRDAAQRTLVDDARAGCRFGARLLLALITTGAPVLAQRVRKRPPPAAAPPARNERAEADAQLARTRRDYIEATKEYREILEKLLHISEENVGKIEASLTNLKSLYTEGLISRRALEDKERELKDARDRVADIRQQIAAAETQIAETLLEAQAEEQMAQAPPVPSGKLVRTTSYIRYNGPAPWSLSDAWKVQRFFQEKFGRQLPVSAFGQSGVHNRLGLNHRDALDVPVNPDGVEGRALVDFLRKSGIPFSAFTTAIPGVATGPHIHVGRPSHRF